MWSFAPVITLIYIVKKFSFFCHQPSIGQPKLKKLKFRCDACCRRWEININIRCRPRGSLWQAEVYNCYFYLCFRERPYHVASTCSRSITEVKQRRARSVLGWVTAWEHRVHLASFFLFLSFFPPKRHYLHTLCHLFYYFLNCIFYDF